MARADLAAAAARAGVSMQTYLLDLILAEARRARNRALIAEVRARVEAGGGDSDPNFDAAGEMRRAREERGEHLASLLGDSA